MNVGAQERMPIAVGGQQKLNVERVPVAEGKASLKNSMYFANTAAGASKTTAAMTRWYNYSVYLQQKADYDRTVAGTGTQFLDFYGPLMWNDTVNMVSYNATTGYGKRHLTLVSFGSVLHPQYPGFNRTDLFGAGIMRLTSADAYSVDSMSFSYWYTQGSKATPGHTDTLRFAFLVGNGSSSNSIFSAGTVGGTGSLYPGGTKFPDVAYDSVLNVAVGKSTGTPAQYMDILFAHNTDTSVFSKSRRFEIKDKSTGLAAPIAVPAANFVSCIMSYKSGDPATILKTLPGDTLAGVGGRYYDIMQPFVDYVTEQDPASNPDTEPAVLYYDSTDFNVGLFKQLPNTDVSGWHNLYLPNWAWSGSFPSGAWYYQSPDLGYHIICNTCNAVTAEVKNASSVNSINAVPNPATSELNIMFSLANATNVSVSLTNVLGQVVATQNINNTANGKATFNTAALPSGVYVYTLQANGEKATGRVVVSH